MTILIRKALVKDIHSPFHNKVCDLLIQYGRIEQISDTIEAQADQIIEQENLIVSPGWVDIFTSGTDPGFEFKDRLRNTAASAAKGGFTHVFLTPNSKPVVQNKTAVQYIINHEHPHPVEFHPIGAITKNTEGKELAEMFEMKDAGAIAFSDGNKPVQSSGLIIKAMQYVKAFDGVIIQVPDDQSVSAGGQMNEGIVSTQIGLPGKPGIAEEIIVSRDIELSAYTNSHVHFTGVTTSKSIQLIEQAKQKGLKITCSTTPHHLYFCDKDVDGYDTNLKFNPPLRTKDERKALIDAVQSGKIDIITSHHTAQNTDLKVCEFEYAGYGAIGLESAYGVLGSLGLDTDQILSTICFNPRKIFKLSDTINIGESADITLFDPTQAYEFSVTDIKSSCNNSPFIGKKLTGKIIGTILKTKTNQN